MQEIKQPKRREALVENAEKARISKRLVTLECGLDVGVKLADTRLAEFDARRLLAFTRALSFTTLTKRVADLYGVDPGGGGARPGPRPALGRRRQRLGGWCRRPAPGGEAPPEARGQRGRRPPPTLPRPHRRRRQGRPASA